MADAKAELIRLAGQMIRGESMPDIESWNWPNRATNKLWAQAIQAEEAAHEKCKQWALAIKEIADALPAEQPAQGEAVADAERRAVLWEKLHDKRVERIRELDAEIARLTTPRVPIVPDEMWAGPPHNVDYVNGWNACRDAMIAAAAGDAQ